MITTCLPRMRIDSNENNIDFISSNDTSINYRYMVVGVTAIIVANQERHDSNFHGY